MQNKQLNEFKKLAVKILNVPFSLDKKHKKKAIL